MSILTEISENLQKGKAKIVAELVQIALDRGVAPDAILNEGLLAGMNIIGEKFKNNEDYCAKIGADIYTPDAASAADAAVELCKG